MNRSGPNASRLAFFARIPACAVFLAICSGPAGASSLTMICPDEIEVAIDPLTCDAVIPATAGGDPNAFVVVVEGIDNVFTTDNGTAEVTVDVDGLFAQSPTPLPIRATATFINGVPGLVNNQCTTDVLLQATTAGRIGETSSSVSCLCPVGSTDSDSDGVCDEADPCPDDAGNACDAAGTTTIFACLNPTNGRIYGFSGATEPTCRKDDQLISWKSSFVGGEP